MNKTIRIGTRNSELALWQAHLVQKKLESNGFLTKIVEISSKGDEVLDIPLHKIGVTGLFTRTLDIALLNKEIDIAVHSLKDVPTVLPNTIIQAAVLERANFHDVLIYKGNIGFLKINDAIIATGSLRRKAQWLHKYPTHTITGLRGNVNTRLKKLKDSQWNAAIFAKAGLERINILPENHLVLDWMIPAPAQGTIMITTLETNEDSVKACAALNHKETEICVDAERQFMRTLEGGCTAPIGAIARLKNNNIEFKGMLSSIDGKIQLEVSKIVPLEKATNIGKIAAKEILANGGDKLMEEIKKVI